MITLTIHRATLPKDVFYRKLRPPLKSWQPTQFYQMPLFTNMGLPLVHP